MGRVTGKIEVKTWVRQHDSNWSIYLLSIYTTQPHNSNDTILIEKPNI